jgi:hypothetical protein
MAGDVAGEHIAIARVPRHLNQIGFHRKGAKTQRVRKEGREQEARLNECNEFDLGWATIT